MSSQFYRLIWKEYRAQRALWLLLAVCMVIGHTLGYWLDASHSSGGVTGVVLFCLCFLTTSIALGFAGEEDQGTAIWIRQFPVSTVTLFLSKFLVTLIGTGAIAIVGAISLGGFQLVGGAPLTETADDAAVWGTVITVFLLMSLFWSLRVSSVFKSMGFSVASVLLLLLGQDVLLSQNPFSSAITWCIAGGLCCLVLFLARRWHRKPSGRMPRIRLMASVDSARPSLLDGLRGPMLPYLQMFAIYLAVPLVVALMFVAVLAGLHFGWPAAVAILVVCLWLLVLVVRHLLAMPPIRRSWLVAAASSATQRRRTMAVLFWKECRFAIPAGLLAIGVGIVATLLRVFYDNGPWPVFVVSVAAVEFGLRTFRSDQQKLNGLFWSHRGVSPLAVLSVRNAVWLGTLMAVAVAMLSIDLPYSRVRMGPGTRIVDVANELGWRRFPGLWTQFSDSPPFNVRVVFLPLTWLIGGFFIGQLASCWIRKPLLAFFAAGGAFGGFAMGLMACHFGDIPLALTVWPIVLVVVVGLVLSRRQWMDRRMALAIGLKRVAFLVIPLCCLWPVKAAWRMNQIPQHSVSLHHTPIEQTRVPYLPREQRSNRENESWLRDWETVTDATRSISSSLVAECPELDEAKFAQAVAAIDRIVPRCDVWRLPPMIKHPWSNYPDHAVTVVVLQKADQLHQAGNPYAALRQLGQGFTLMRFLQNEATSWDQRHRAMEMEQFLLQRLHHVAADDRLTEKQLQLAANGISELLEHPVETWTLLGNRGAFYTQLLLRPMWVDSDFVFPINSGHRVPLGLINASVAERRRFVALMSQSDAWTLKQGKVVPADTGGLETVSGPPEARDIVRWESTTRWDTDLREDPVFTGKELEQVTLGDDRVHFMDAESRALVNAERATWLILQLQKYRRVHGEFPDGLETLRYDTEVDSIGHKYRAFFDVEANVPFQYARNGVEYDFLTNTVHVASTTTADVTLITKNQPILWSSRVQPRGRKLLDFEPVEAIVKEKNRAVLPNSKRIVWLNDSRTVPPMGGIGRWRTWPDSDHAIELRTNDGEPIDVDSTEAKPREAKPPEVESPEVESSDTNP